MSMDAAISWLKVGWIARTGTKDSSRSRSISSTRYYNKTLNSIYTLVHLFRIANIRCQVFNLRIMCDFKHKKQLNTRTLFCWSVVSFCTRCVLAKKPGRCFLSPRLQVYIRGSETRCRIPTGVSTGGQYAIVSLRKIPNRSNRGLTTSRFE